jgi:ABC-2 type transport system permease protein
VIRKEWTDQRLKLIIGLSTGLVTLLIGIFLAPGLGGLSPNPELKATIAEATGDYPAYIWDTLFNPGNSLGLVLLILASSIGTSLIAGEVARSTIFLLLSRPLTRAHLLLTKYAVGAAGLLMVILILTAALLVMTAAVGQPQHLGGALISALLLWLGSLFVLGLATLFSVMFRSVLLPLALSLAVTGLLAFLPALLRLPVDWSLPNYWSSFPAFLGQQVPIRELLVSSVAAAAPILLALLLFRRRQY